MEIKVNPNIYYNCLGKFSEVGFWITQRSRNVRENYHSQVLNGKLVRMATFDCEMLHFYKNFNACMHVEVQSATNLSH